MTAQPQDHLESLKNAPKTLDVETSNGVITLPHPAHVPGGIIRKARKQPDEIEQFFFIVESLLGEDSEALDALDKLPMWEQQIVFQQWGQGASMGESSRSES